MKKIYSLIAAALMVAPTFAQVVLVDPEGKEYTNGQAMTIYAEDIEVTDGVITWAECPCPSVKNKGSESVQVAFEFTIKELLPKTRVQYCWPATCFFAEEAGTYTTDPGELKASGDEKGGDIKPMNIEWVPGGYDMEEGDYVYYQGSCTIEYKILVGGKVSGTNEVTYICEIPAGITALQSSSKAGVAYDLQGRLAKASTRGLLIKNGKKCLVR